MRRSRGLANLFLVLVLGLGISACNRPNNDSSVNGDAAGVAAVPVGITGTFSDDYGGSHTINSQTWTMVGFGSTSVFHILNATTSYIIARNDNANPYDNGLFSRFDFFRQQDGTIAFCQTAYSATSAQLAMTTPAADINFLSTGCGNFPFSILTAVSVAGAKPVVQKRQVANDAKRNTIPRRGPESKKRD